MAPVGPQVVAGASPKRPATLGGLIPWARLVSFRSSPLFFCFSLSLQSQVFPNSFSQKQKTLPFRLAPQKVLKVKATSLTLALAVLALAQWTKVTADVVHHVIEKS